MGARRMMKGISRKPAARQRGMISVFTAVLVLILLTLMMIFAVQAGVFEQRDSSNDDRQKRAFHAAESGIELAKEYIIAHSAMVGSYEEDLLANGSDGWHFAGAPKWQSCADVDLSAGHGSHPCYGEPIANRRATLYYYQDPDTGATGLPLGTAALDTDDSIEQVSVEALLCMVTEGFTESPTTVEPCTLDPDATDDTMWVITFLARGEADCGTGTCLAEAKIAERMAQGGAIASGRAPDVPLVTKSSFPPSGTAEVVPNPNAGGEGVPISLWGNDNDSCDGLTPVDPSSGSWATCEYHEWYAQDIMPDDGACPGNCSCTEAEAISYTKSTTDVLGMDLVLDEDFPCDLFAYFFGVPREDYEVIKSSATVINDCTILDENSFGIYWATGELCLVNSNVTVGSLEAPVVLISAATVTRFNGGAELFGVLYIADVEDSGAEFFSKGNNTVYGTVIVDAGIGAYNGTFQVVYNDIAIDRGANRGTLVGLAGGWTDFHKDWE